MYNGQGPNFAKETLEWMIDSVKSHMESHEDSYSFRKEDIKLLCDQPRNVNAIVHCIKHNASKWLIKRMLSYYWYTPSNPESIPARWQSMESMSAANRDLKQWMNDGIMTLDNTEGILGPYIEKTDPAEIDEEWMLKRRFILSFNEYFDLIFDDQCMDNVLYSENVQTTIYGQCLKKGGIIYVSDCKVPGDIDGQKLGSKMGGLYPNSHFELIAERDRPQDKQFVFLKTLSCAEKNVDRESDRKDE